jgi:hypothetical protein
MCLCGSGDGAHGLGGGLPHRGFLSGESERDDDSDEER